MNKIIVLLVTFLTLLTVLAANNLDNKGEFEGYSSVENSKVKHAKCEKKVINKVDKYANMTVRERLMIYFSKTANDYYSDMNRYIADRSASEILEIPSIILALINENKENKDFNEKWAWSYLERFIFAQISWRQINKKQKIKFLSIILDNDVFKKTRKYDYYKLREKPIDRTKYKKILFPRCYWKTTFSSYQNCFEIFPDMTLCNYKNAISLEIGNPIAIVINYENLTNELKRVLTNLKKEVDNE